MTFARKETDWFNHEYIGTEHILLGMIAHGANTGTEALDRLGIDRNQIRRDVLAIVQSAPPNVIMGEKPFTPRAKRVLELSVEEAADLGQNYIGAEHLLLGLIRENEGVAAQVLMSRGLRVEKIRETVKNILDSTVGDALSDTKSPPEKPKASKKPTFWVYAYHADSSGELHEFLTEKEAINWMSSHLALSPGTGFTAIEGHHLNLKVETLIRIER